MSDLGFYLLQMLNLFFSVIILVLLTLGRICAISTLIVTTFHHQQRDHDCKRRRFWRYCQLCGNIANAAPFDPSSSQSYHCSPLLPLSTAHPGPHPHQQADVLQVNQYGDICFGLVCLIIVYLQLEKKVLFTFQKSSAIRPWSISTPASAEPFIIVNSARGKKIRMDFVKPEGISETIAGTTPAPHFWHSKNKKQNSWPFPMLFIWLFLMIVFLP